MATEDVKGREAFQNMVGAMVVIVDGAGDIGYQGGMIGNSMAVEKMVFEVLVGCFDHGVGGFDVTLGDKMPDYGTGSRVDPVGKGTGIFGPVIGKELTAGEAGGLEVLLMRTAEIVQGKLGGTGGSDPAGKDGPGEVVLQQIDKIPGVVGRSEKSGIGMKELERGGGADTGVMIFPAMGRGLSFESQQGDILVEGGDGESGCAVPSQLVKDGGQGPVEETGIGAVGLDGFYFAG